MTFSVDQVDADKRFIDFRHRWLRNGKPRETAVFRKDLSENTYHFAAVSNQKILGIVSYFDRQHDCFQDNLLSYQLRGMAVDQNYRQQKIGRYILKDSLVFLQSKGIDLIWCNARKESWRFYQKYGFKSTGKFFLIPDVGQHILMYKYL